MNAPPTPREYEVRAETAPTFGRVLCSARHHHFVADGPIQNGCPGEALTPAELFLSGVAACGTEIMQVIARDEGIPFERVSVVVQGTIDRSSQPREGVTLFNHVRITVRLVGPSPAQAEVLTGGFRRRCPLYGTLSVAALEMDFVVHTEG
jgi:uncharacterized OsmC-like protein